MAKLNTCERCGHYSWVHGDGKCELEYCDCGKEKREVVSVSKPKIGTHGKKRESHKRKKS